MKKKILLQKQNGTMTVYNKEQKWKKWLLLFAILIAAFSIIFTNNLVKELKKEERKKIELWAQATKNLVNISSDGDFSLAINVIVFQSTEI